MVGQILPRTERARQPAPPPMTPGQRADELGKLGYEAERIGGGVYLIEKPDGTKYRVDVIDRRCSCPASTVCKHILFCDWYWAYDRAKAQLATAYTRDILVHAHEDAFYAAACDFMAVTGVDMWDEMRGWQRAERGRAVAQ